MPKSFELPQHGEGKPHSNSRLKWIWGDGRQKSDKGKKSEKGIELSKIQSISSTRGLKGDKKNSQTKPSEGLSIGKDGYYKGYKGTE
jgi:hypothetical protein